MDKLLNIVIVLVIFGIVLKVVRPCEKEESYGYTRVGYNVHEHPEFDKHRWN